MRFSFVLAILVAATFLDKHTLKLAPISDNKDDFEIAGSGRVVHIKLK